jgi:DNA modification methylase
MKNAKIENNPVDLLKPYENNSRTHSDESVEQIVASIKRWGWTMPILIDEENTVIAGHARLMAAKKIGLKDVPCLRVNEWSDDQKKAYVIADNQLAMGSDWDYDILASEIQDLIDVDFDVSALGFDESDLDEIFNGDFADVDEIEGLTDDDEVPEAPENPVSVLGDVWTLGNHRLMCGDSTSVEAVDKLMDGNLAQTFFTDPPYGDNVGGLEPKKGSEKIKGKGLVKRVSFIKNDKDIDWLEDVFNIVPTFLEKENTKMVFFKWDRLEQIKQMASAFGEPSALCVWDRVRKASAFFRFQPQQELHPTVKPLGILEPVIGVTTSPSKIVLDLFGGSGSTLIACEKTGRKARLMELDEKYVDTIICRWQDFTGKEAIHAETGKTYNIMKHEQQGKK